MLELVNWKLAYEKIQESKKLDVAEREASLGYACNYEFFNKFVSPSFAIAMYSMLAVGVLLNLACWKYRKLAMGLFYYECFMLLLTNFMPIN